MSKKTIKDITDDDLDTYQRARAQLARGVQPGDITVRGWMKRYKLNAHDARCEITRLARAGVLELVGKRYEGGSVVSAYRLVEE
jgi:hypothetical protein